MNKTLYDVLRVSQSADADIIEAAYQLIKSKLETKGDLDSQNELKGVLWAYQTLIDVDRRTAYDSQLSQNDAQYISTVNFDVTNRQLGGFMDWWSSNKVTAIITAVAVFTGANIYLDYRKEANKNEVLKTIMVNGEKNEGKAIEVGSSIAQQEQDRRRAELEYRDNAAARAIEMQQRQRDQQLEMQRQQLEMQRQRQETLLKSQQQQLEQQRIQREQRYYSCYNSAWNRFHGDGASAAAACLPYK